MGIIVYYNPTLHVVDDTGASLPNAQVYIAWPNGSRDTLPRYTSANGFINLTHILPGNYGLTILWKDVVPNQTTIYLDSDGLYIIKTAVYQLTVKVLGNTEAAICGAYVIVYTQTGLGYGLAITNEAGQVVFKLPEGTYNIEAHYSAGYWLSVVATSEAALNVPINTSTSNTIVLSEFPPAIWTTTGFWLLVALVAVLAFITVYMSLIRRKRIV